MSGLGLLSLSSCAQIKKKIFSKPNVVFILADDLGWKDLSCYGSTFHQSPNIDAFAKTGMVFSQAYAASPVCSPTRAALMTGRHPVRVNITDWLPGDNAKKKKLQTPKDLSHLPLEENTVAEAFNARGYKTFFAGKWHLGGNNYLPEDQGFVINKGGYHKGQPMGGYYSPYKNPKLKDGPKGEYLTDRLTNESIQFIKENKGNPFFLFLSFYTVHTPIQKAKKHIHLFEKKGNELSQKKEAMFKKEHKGYTRMFQSSAAFASMVYAMDENVGRLLKCLDDMKLNDNTIVVFTSDNGGLSTLYRKGGPTSNAPLRAGKGWCYEGGIRVPAIVRAPGWTKAGTVSHEPIISMDFFPTLLDYVGFPLQPKDHVDGLSLKPVLKDQKALGRKALYWHYPHYHGSAWETGSAVRAGEWKLVQFYDEAKVELYNLQHDLSEEHDLAPNLPKKTKEMLDLLVEWQKKIGAKIPRSRT